MTDIANTSFEGPEKILEVDFVPNHASTDQGRGLRVLTRQDWDEILGLAQCKILSKIENHACDAFVLSESSLFVYAYKCFLKTCGTTTLLKCVSLLLEKARSHGMELEWLGYMRKNFLFPSMQQHPHTSFMQEVDFAKEITGPFGEHLDGGAYKLGDLCGDHWNIYVADYNERPSLDSTDVNFNVMMYDLDPTVLRLFHLQGGSQSCKTDGKRALKASGLQGLLPETALVDDYMFEPCGYSMNALNGEDFFTVHITPELEHSYASFETNLHLEEYDAYLQRIVRVFRPQRVSVTIFADEGAYRAIRPVQTDVLGAQGFVKLETSSTCFKTDYVCWLANFSLLPKRCGSGSPGRLIL